MEIGKASTYALMAMVYIAEHAQARPMQGREIAKECDLPFGYLLKILQSLVRREILKSQVGRLGGFKLCRLPHDISALQIIEAVDGPIAGKAAFHSRSRISKHAIAILEMACQSAATSAREEFGGIKLGDLLEHPSRHGARVDSKSAAAALKS